MKSIIWISLFLLLLVIYTCWDNNRVKVVEQDIKINDLNEELEGFSILQITDLHEKTFGKNQEKLIELINSLQYDVIVFTGDILKSPESKNYEPFFRLLEGIYNKKHVLFVPGNTDPEVSFHERTSLSQDAFYKGMEERGVKYLDFIYPVESKTSSIKFVNMGNLAFNDKSDMDQVEYSEAIIALNHYPVVDVRIDSLIKDTKLDFRKHDLIIAGHYHGGQIRFPLIGTLFVPEPMYEKNGLFPPQNRIKGLWEYKGIKQYVSTGLGSSDAIPFFNFRFFNTPEINILRLRKQ